MTTDGYGDMTVRTIGKTPTDRLLRAYCQANGRGRDLIGAELRRRSVAVPAVVMLLDNNIYY